MVLSETRRKAETAAKVYLEMRGFTLLEQNFRRPRCTVDIIAEKENTIHFFEVIYHEEDGDFGSSDTISAAKLRQMKMAAAIWTEESKWTGEIMHSSLELTGSQFTVMNFSEGIA